MFSEAFEVEIPITQTLYFSDDDNTNNLNIYLFACFLQV